MNDDDDIAGGCGNGHGSPRKFLEAETTIIRLNEKYFEYGVLH